MNMASYKTAVAIGAVAIFFTDFASYTEQLGIAPLYWVILFCLASIPLVVNALFGQRLQFPPVAIWAVAYLIISILWFYSSTQSPLAFQQLRNRVLSVIFLGLMLFLFSDTRIQRKARVAVAFAVVFAASLNIYEMFNPMTFSTIPGRSSGLYTNVLQSGAAMVLGMILSMGVVPSRLRIPYVLVIGVGIFATFSRSALVGWMLILMLMAVQSGLHLKHLRGVGIAALLIIGFIVSPWWTNLQRSLEERGVLTMDVLERLTFFNSGRAADQSASDRERVMEIAWNTFAERPMAGLGTGSYTELPFHIAPHNMFLALMIDHGILGAFIVPALILAVLWGVRRSLLPITVPFGVFFLWWSFFSHNVLEERYILLAVALLASMVTSVRQPKHATAPAVPQRWVPARSATV